MRAGIGAPDLQISIGVRPDNHGVGFAHEVVILRGGKGVGPNQVAFLQDRVHIAYVDIYFHIAIAGVILVNQGRSVRQGLVDGEDARQDFIIHVYQPQGFESGVFVHGGYSRHFIAHIPHLIGLKHLHVAGVGKDAPLDAGRVPTRDYRFNAGQLFGSGGVYVQDARVGIRTSKDLAHQHSRKNQITGEFHLARGSHP